MKKPLYPVFLLLGLLLSVQNVFAVFIVSPTQGHPNITVTLSDKVGDSSSTIGRITFGTIDITAVGHSLTAINGATIDGNDEVVTNLAGEYMVTFTVPTDSSLALGEYTIRIGNNEDTDNDSELDGGEDVNGNGVLDTEKTQKFLLTGPVQDVVEGQVGTALRLSGQFGVANQSVGSITFGTDAITSASHGLAATKGQILQESGQDYVYSDADGAYDVSFEIPDHVYGPVKIELSSKQLDFQILPSVTLSGSATVKYGDTITLNGTGFNVLDTITIIIGGQDIIGGQKTVLPSGTVGANGRFAANITIGHNRWQPKHDIVVTTDASGSRIELVETLTIEPSIEVSPGGGTENTTVSIKGYNFAGVGDAQDETVYIDFGSTGSITEVRSVDFGGRSPGSFNVSFVINIKDQTSGGQLTIKARGTKSTPDATAFFLYSHPDSNQVLQISDTSTSYTPGGTVDLVGTGFPKSVNIGAPSLKPATGNLIPLSIATYTYGTDTNSDNRQVTADTDGKFQVSLSVPAEIPRGEYKLLIDLEDTDGDGILDPGEDTNGNNQLDYHQTYQTLNIIPKITLTAGQEDKIGQTFTVEGVGFQAAEVVDVKLADDNVESAGVVHSPFRP